MLQNVADFTARAVNKDKSQKQAPETQNQIPEQLNVERIWQILIEKIEDIGSDQRVEIRRSNIHTLENIIMAHGSLLSPQIWVLILKNVILNMFKNSVEMYS
mmetsp:Transcript_30487/g.29876  ORF Transcript_30487/g.29876 Transcript_30487/m.29876 type:complete len:102 (-) Transcript_30487:1257-1562(-)